MAQMSYYDYFDAKDNDDEAKIEKEKERRTSGSFKFNIAAPEFVPTVAHTEGQLPITGYFYPCFQYIDGTNGSWIYVTDQEITIPLVQSKSNVKGVNGHNSQQQQQQQVTKEVVISDELKQKIIKQAEYMFSDMSMLANESLVKHVNKDPEGFVPINFVATLKKLKSLNVNNQMVAQALRSSTKLVVSNDGKKVRRKNPFTEKEKEDLQLRTVIAENLPDDHSHQKIEKMFNVVGSIKSIRICQPQEPNSSRSSKGDVVISNKLHALVEYENPETAEKAAEKLNDEGNWRKGMRVRLMLKRSPKSVLKSRKSDFDVYLDDESHQLHEDSSRVNSSETSDADENSAASKKSWIRNRGKPKPRPLQTARSLPTPLTSSCPGEVSARQIAKGPRMPDGTRGFTMGRGKPITIQVQSS
ncbi:hypothetical protein BUALT_Bualt19G0113800 [Buddleja alternifolia]|uniref:La-related protein 6C n=1 Tax=Buddleja alternifolia TaxID=168488 RepID=A0AAV6W7C5_9LAMI|nr:hypothetical protein BUALT_Bualt19G0113800 [Buddleja alternifolia]